MTTTATFAPSYCQNVSDMTYFDASPTGFITVDISNSLTVSAVEDAYLTFANFLHDGSIDRETYDELCKKYGHAGVGQYCIDRKISSIVERNNKDVILGIFIVNA